VIPDGISTGLVRGLAVWPTGCYARRIPPTMAQGTIALRLAWILAWGTRAYRGHYGAFWMGVGIASTVVPISFPPVIASFNGHFMARTCGRNDRYMDTIDRG